MIRHSVTAKRTDQGTASARLVSTQTHNAAKEAVKVENETQQGPGDARDFVLGRLWELANIGPDQTKGNIDGQVKAIAMMIEIVGLLPDEDATPAAAATNARMYVGKPYRRPGHTEPDEELEAAYKA